VQLVKASFLTIVCNVFRLGGSLIVNKIIATYLGPTALGLLGQIQSFTNTLISFGTGLTQQGVVKLISENHKNPKALEHIVSTGYFFMLMGNIIVIGMTYLLKPLIIEKVFDNIYSFDFIILIIFSLALMCFNTFVMNMFLGFSKIKSFSIVHILWSIQNVILNAVLIFQYKMEGAIYGFILNQSIVLVITLFYVRRFKWRKYLFSMPRWHKSWVVQFTKYSMVSTMSVILVPVVYIFMRTLISKELGWTVVGYWESINKLSYIYIYFMSMIVNVYFIPTYSKESLQVIKDKFLLHLSYCIGIFVLTATVLYFFRKPLILFIFSEDFLSIEKYLIYQLIGDFFRVIGFFVSSIFIARARLKNQLLIEFSTILLFPLFTLFTIGKYQLEGVLYAYIIWYLAYDILLLSFIHKVFKN
jgi:PST family polysaccharide transporter